MMNIFTKVASFKDKTLLTLTNGNVLEGEIVDFGTDYIILKTNRGIAGIHYNMVGAWELLLDSSEDQSQGEKEVIYNEIEPEITVNYTDVEYVQTEYIESQKDDKREKEEYTFIDIQLEALLRDFSIKISSAKLTLLEPEMSFPLNSLVSENLSEDKKRWDKINNQYNNCLKNRNYSQLSTLAFELLEFAEKYPSIGVFHYNAGCFMILTEKFEQSYAYFEEAFARESLPRYIYGAAYSALEIQDYEKTHFNLAVYFGMVNPIDDQEAWYTFCRLTEKELQNYIFSDILLSFFRDTTNEGRREAKCINMVSEDDILKSALFTLKSALYFLKKNSRCKDAVSLIEYLKKTENGEQALSREEVFSLLDSSLSEFSREKYGEYKKLIEVLESHGKSNLDENRGEKGTHNNDIDINILNVSEKCEIDIEVEESKKGLLQTFSLPKDENLVKNETSEKLYIKIPRIHGYVYKYITPKGYGFIKDVKGNNYFFHLNSIIDDSISLMEISNIRWGTDIHVIFQPTRNKKGKVAIQISNYQVLSEMKKLAERYAEGRNYKKAIELCEYVLSIDSDYPISRSVLEDWQGKCKEVLEEEQKLNDHIKSEPNSREGWDSKASFLIKNKRYEEALSILDKVIELTPDVVNLLPSGRHLFSFNEIYNSNPEYTRALRKKSFILYKLERNKEALKIINETLELDSDESDSLTLKASILLNLERVQEANEIIDYLLEKGNNSWQLFFLKGKILLCSYRYKEGLDFLKKALDRSPRNSDVLLKCGYALSKLERFDAAIKAYDKVTDIQPENTKALSNKGFILIMIGEYEKALDMFNGLIQLNPFNIRLWSKRGAILTRINRYEDALRAANRVLEIDPKDAKTLFTKGYIYSKIFKYEEALNYFDQVLELSPFDQKALAKRAFVLLKLGRHEDAFVSIEEVLEVNKRNPKSWYYKGLIHYNLGEYDEALIAFNKSVELNPTDKWAEKMKQFTIFNLGLYEGELEDTISEHLVEEELFDKEFQEDFDAEFKN